MKKIERKDRAVFIIPVVYTLGMWNAFGWNIDYDKDRALAIGAMVLGFLVMTVLSYLSLRLRDFIIRTFRKDKYHA